jgi:hypothetical protein
MVDLPLQYVAVRPNNRWQVQAIHLDSDCFDFKLNHLSFSKRAYDMITLKIKNF